MTVPPGENSTPQEARPRRQFMTRAELVTMVGMLLVVFSLFFAWERPVVKMPPLPSMYMDLKIRPRTGFASEARWPLILCALVCGTTLLWAPTEKLRLPLAVVQGACGLACLVIALTKLALLPGTLMGLLGGALLTYGAVDRFTVPTQMERET